MLLVMRSYFRGPASDHKARAQAGKPDDHRFHKRRLHRCRPLATAVQLYFKTEYLTLEYFTPSKILPK